MFHLTELSHFRRSQPSGYGLSIKTSLLGILVCISGLSMAEDEPVRFINELAESSPTSSGISSPISTGLDERTEDGFEFISSAQINAIQSTSMIEEELVSFEYGPTVEDVLDGFERQANDFVIRYGAYSNHKQKNAALNVLSILEQVREIYRDNLLVKKADQRQIMQTHFDGFTSRLSSLLEIIRHDSDKINSKLANLAHFVSNTIFVGDMPRVARFLSNIGVFGSTQGNELKIKVEGVNLLSASSKVYMTLGQTPLIEPSEITNEYFIFSINDPVQLGEFENDEDPRLIPIEVSIIEEDYLFFTKTKKYQFQVRMVPNKIASAVINFNGDEDVYLGHKSKKVKGPEGSFQSGRYSTRFRKFTMKAYPDKGYEINPKTLRFDWGESGACNRVKTRCAVSLKNNTSEASCSIASSRGEGVRLACGYALSMSFEQYKVEKRASEYETDSLVVSYDTPIKWTLPKGKSLDNVELVLRDGRKVTLDETTSAEEVAFSFNKSSRTLMVSNSINLESLN